MGPLDLKLTGGIQLSPVTWVSSHSTPPLGWLPVGPLSSLLGGGVFISPGDTACTPVFGHTMPWQSVLCMLHSQAQLVGGGPGWVAEQGPNLVPGQASPSALAL